MSSHSDVASVASVVSGGNIPPDAHDGNAAAKAKKSKWTRGGKSTPMQRAAQFPREFEVRGEAMWCCACHVPVKHKEKTFAKTHLASAAHKRFVEKKKTKVGC